MTKKKFLKSIDNLIRNTSDTSEEFNYMTKKAASIQKKESKKSKTVEIKLESILTIDQSYAIKEKITEAYGKNNKIRLTADRCNSLDLSVIQLFYSLFMTAQEGKEEIEINIPLNEELKNLLKNAGIYKFFAGEKENKIVLTNKN